MKPTIGSVIETWFPGGVVISVEPYTGLYPQFFTWVVRVTAPNTRRGWLEMAVK